MRTAAMAKGIDEGRGGVCAAAIATLCIMLVAGSVAASVAGSTQRSAPVPLLNVRLGGDAIQTRVVLDLEGPVSGRLEPSETTPEHLVLAFPPLDLGGPSAGPGLGLVKSWRVRSGPAGGRLVLEMSGSAQLVKRFLIAPTDGQPHYRYVVDIAMPRPVAALTPTAPPRLAPLPPIQLPLQPVAAAAVRPSEPPMAEPARRIAPALMIGPMRADPPRTRPVRAALTHPVRVIVIDAGHGGHDSGARSLVRSEKDITLASALALKERLEGLGRYRVVLTRDSDVYVPLEERVKIARRAKADLFISLHADSAGPDPTPHGASVYTLSDHGETRVNYVLGHHEWFDGFSAKADPAVGQILLDLTQRSTRNRSSAFAKLLIDHLSGRVDLLPRSHRDAGYFVLLAPDVPAALLEMGFITNPQDALRLTDPAQRDRLMDGVAEAIDDYFNG